MSGDLPLPPNPRRVLVLTGALLLLAGTAPRASAEEASIQVTLTPVAGVDEVAFSQGHLQVQLPDETRRLPLPGSPSLTFSIPDGASAVLRAEVPGFWSPQATVIGQPGTREVGLRLFPAAEVKGRFTWPRGMLPPTRMMLTLDPPWSSGGGSPGGSVPHATESCTVALSGAFRCVLPAARLDLRLRVTGFVSLYFWDLALRPGESLDVGALALTPGASVVLWVEDAEGRPPSVPVTATLKPAEVIAGSHRGTGVDRLALRGKADKRGFLHLEGVPAGAYRLQVQAEGFAPLTRRLQVVEGREVRLPEPLVLAPPSRLELTLVPPQDPYGRPWEVRSWGAENEGASPWQRANEEGQWRSEPLAPGLYLVQVESGRGRYRQGWWSDTVEVAAGGTSQEIRLPVVEVVGTVRLGEEPLEAVVRFGKPHGGRTLQLDADPEGVFAGYLPKEGEWPVSVYTEPTGWRTLPPVEVEVEEGDRYAELELVLPDTTLPGEVVDAQGEPLPGVRVTGFHADERFELSDSVSDEEGRFLLRGVTPGRVMLSAQGAGGASGGAMVTVPEKGSTEPVRLVLQKFESFQGRVTSPAGPVPGAQIIAFPRGMGLFISEQGRILTGPDGRFETRVPASATAVDVAVLAPGWAARLLRVAAPWPEEIAVEVRPGGGTLELAVSDEGRTSLRHDGAELPFVFVDHWGRRGGVEGGNWRLPDMEPGTWELCLRGGGAEARPACSRGFLPPGGLLELTTPKQRDLEASARTP